MSSQGPNHPETTISADVMRARSQALGDLLRRTAARKPDKLALVNGELRWSYRELDQAVNRAAASLSERGLSQGDRLALVSHNCWHYVVLAFATARIGAVLVPVNFMLTAEVAAVLAAPGGGGGVFPDDPPPAGGPPRGGGGCPPGGPRGGPPPGGAAGGGGGEDVPPGPQGDDVPPEVHVADDDPLRLMYTSGTESRPKGAIMSSRSLIAQYVSCVVDGGMEPDDVELHSLPLYHCAQMDCFLGPDIYLGATNVILAAPDPATVLRTIATEKITKFFAPPTVWIAMLRPGLRPHRPVLAAQGLLRRLGDAGRGAARDSAASSRSAPVELLRSDRDGSAGHDLASAGPDQARRLRRPTCPERRDASGRRRRPTRACR